MSEAPRRLSVTMNQQLKDGDCSVWQLCPLTHTLGHLNYSNPGETSQAVLSWRQQQALMGWDGSEFPGGTHRGSGQGRCSTSPPRAGGSAESPQHSSGAWKLLRALPAGPGFRSCSGSQEPQLQQQQRVLPGPWDWLGGEGVVCSS